MNTNRCDLALDAFNVQANGMWQLEGGWALPFHQVSPVKLCRLRIQYLEPPHNALALLHCPRLAPGRS